MWITKQCHFAPIKTVFFLFAHKRSSFENTYYGKPKNKFLIGPSYWRSKGFVFMTGLGIWSQNWVWIIFDPYFGQKNTKKSLKSRFRSIVTVSGQNMGQILSKRNSDTRFGIHSSRGTLEIPNRKRDYFSIVFFSKFGLLCADQKCSFIGEKWHFIAIHIPWHGIRSENLENVEFGNKWNALLSVAFVDLVLDRLRLTRKISQLCKLQWD